MMAYTPLYKPSPRFFDLPKIDHHSNISPDFPIIVLFLVKTSQRQRDEVLKELNAREQHWPDNVEPRTLDVVLWLRNYTLEPDAVLSAVCGTGAAALRCAYPY